MTVHATTSIPPPLNIAVASDYDDVFSDGDVQESFHFSPDELRQQLANIHGILETEDRETDEGVPEPPSFGLQEIHESLPNIGFGGMAQTLQRDTPPRSAPGSAPSTGTKRSFEDLPISPAESPYPAIIVAPLDTIRTSTESALSSGTLSNPPSASPLVTPEPYTPKSEPTPDRTVSPPISSSVHDRPSSSSSLPVPLQESNNAKLTNKLPIHRHTRSGGPSMLEKVMSKTRPIYLPPKPKREDLKHLSDWQNMMKTSQQAAEKRRKVLQERRLLREKAIEESIQQWEQEIVPDWRVVHKNPALRKLWWRGIPTKLRAWMWERAVGNPLALNKDHYRSCLSRAKRALASGSFPEGTLSLIEEDISTTLPSLHIFNRDSGPLYADLRDMLCAWVVSRSDEGLGYTTGVAKLAAMTLINMPVQQGFNVMKNLLERHCLRSFYGGEAAQEDVEAYYRIFDTLLADGMPKIYFNFKQHQISPSSYLPEWILPLFLDHLPFDACARIWDVIVLEGDSFLYRAALGILAVLEPRLFFPERKELLEVLKGDNKAAKAVAKRERRSLDGGKYEIYGLDEELLWERIESMNDWWKESNWTRLIQRELPDV
ncbi:Rab-GTPase-TBC domain containing protein [Amanita muscaria]